jgi:hypothetical protein
MAQLKENSRENAILKLQKDAAETTVKMALEKKPEIKDSTELKGFLKTTPGEHLLNQIALAERDERAKIDLHHQSPHLMAMVKKCNYCKRRGYLGIEVIYEKDAKGAYVRDAQGQPILKSSTPRLCKCVLKHTEALKIDLIRKWAIDEYAGQKAQEDKETIAESKPAPKKRTAKTKPAVDNGDVPKTPKRKRPPITE